MKINFPSSNLFEQACERGLSVVRPLVPSSEASDEFGWNYGRARPPSYWAYGRLRALLTLNIAIALQPKRVLEVAAGDAALCACLQQTGCEVVANDIRSDNLESSVACFQNRDQIQLLAGNVFDLDPITTGRFDLVIACEIIEHVAHASDLLMHLRRFLSPGGRVLLTTPNGAYFRNKLPTHSEIKDFQELETRQFKPDSDGHLFLITPREMRQLAKEARFQVESMLLWGSPFISGESGFRFLARLPLPFYRLELACKILGKAVEERLYNNMAVILSVPDIPHAG